MILQLLIVGNCWCDLVRLQLEFHEKWRERDVISTSMRGNSIFFVSLNIFTVSGEIDEKITWMRRNFYAFLSITFFLSKKCQVKNVTKETTNPVYLPSNHNSNKNFNLKSRNGKLSHFSDRKPTIDLRFSKCLLLLDIC